MSEPAVLLAGTVNADVVMRVDGPLADGASLIAERMLRTSGGRAGNAAVMGRRLGVAARLFGCVGHDDLAEQALRGPRAARVDLGGIRRVSRDTGLVTILVGAGGTKTMVMAPGANDDFSPADADRLAAAVHASARGSVLLVDSELTPAMLEPALEAARAAGRVSILDPTRPGRVTERLLALGDHVMPNADEAARLTGIAAESHSGALRAARELHRRGPRHVHVRLRQGGCLTLWPGGGALITGPGGVAPVDTTGAGDAFAGTLAAGIVTGLAPLDAVRRAVAAAACAVTRLGAQESYPDRRRLDATARGLRVSAVRDLAPASDRTGRRS